MPRLFFWAELGALISPERAIWHRRYLKACRSVGVDAGGHYLQQKHADVIGKQIASWAADARLGTVELAGRFRVLALVLRAFGLFAIVTGGLDIIAGTHMHIGAGAHLSPDAAVDPVLNSQIKYLGAVWCGFGATSCWATADLLRRVELLRILAATVFLGGIGDLISLMLYGAGPKLFVAFIVIELLGAPSCAFARASFAPAFCRLA